MISAKPQRRVLPATRRLAARELRMTMAVGFVCRDGLVIGADRQVTGTNYTFPERKLRSAKWQNGHAISAYSGNHDTFLDFFSELGVSLPDDATLTHKDIARLLKECASKVLAKKEQFFTLFGYWLDGERPQLLMTTPSRVLNITQCEVIGYADSPLARSLLGRFKAVPGLVSVNQARFYAVRFISEAKQYDGQYVGDGIDVFSIDQSGDNEERCVRVLDAGQTVLWEEQLRVITYWMDILFRQLTETEYDFSINEFSNKLPEFRKWVESKALVRRY